MIVDDPQQVLDLLDYESSGLYKLMWLDSGSYKWTVCCNNEIVKEMMLDNWTRPEFSGLLWQAMRMIFLKLAYISYHDEPFQCTELCAILVMLTHLGHEETRSTLEWLHEHRFGGNWYFIHGVFKVCSNHFDKWYGGKE